jgi:hypothetical protein
MLTRNEAVQFLENSWKMNDVESQVKTDKEMFLNSLIRTMYERVPFQILSCFRDMSLILNKKKKMVYTVKEINEMCMSGLGGNCSITSTFAWQILKALGYSVHLCGVTITSLVTNHHLALIVKDLVNPGDMHLVDCGLGQPVFKAISLNFYEESPIFQESYLEYKYIKHGDKVLRMHGDGDLVKHNNPPDERLDFIRGKWRRFYEFNLSEDFERKVLKEFGEHFDMPEAPEMYVPRAAIYPEGKAHMISANYLITEQEDKTLKRTKMGSNDEVMKAYRDYFPNIDKNLVSLAYSTWNQVRQRRAHA